MPSPPSGQASLSLDDVDRGPEQGPRLGAPAPATVRVDLGLIPVQRARELLVTLAATGNGELADVIRRELEDLDRPPF